MLIRSQDKQKLVSMDSAVYLAILEERKPDHDQVVYSILALWGEAEYTHIGKYSTKEKAEDVLDHIEEAACDWELLKASGHDLFAYYMPPDDAPWLNRRDDNAENNQTK